MLDRFTGPTITVVIAATAVGVTISVSICSSFSFPTNIAHTISACLFVSLIVRLIRNPMVAGWRRDLSSADSPLDTRRHGLIHCAVEGGGKHARRILLIPLTSITTVAFAT
jgi:hypothetical protein